MEVYKRETEEILRRLLERETGLSECKSALNAAFADVLVRLDGKQLDSLRVLLMAHDDIVTKEMETRRGAPKKCMPKTLQSDRA